MTLSLKNVQIYPRLKQFIITKYGEKLVIIANESPEKALELMRQLRKS